MKESKAPFIGHYNKSVILTYIGVLISIIGIINHTATNTALICLVLAGICDLFDGVIARKCKRTDDEKNFAIQIDSLADIISFLVLPSIILISKIENKALALIVIGSYVLAGVTRLAWFNVHTSSNSPHTYFDGLPVTYSALIIPVVSVIMQMVSFEHFLIYCVLYVLLGVLYISNIKIKKPSGIWYGVFSLLAIVVIGVILSL